MQQYGLENEGSGPLLTREVGMAEIVVPPRSRLVGMTRSIEHLAMGEARVEMIERVLGELPQGPRGASLKPR